MAYRQVYFRIRTDCYNSGWTSDVDRTAFEKKSRRLFQELGWTATLGYNGGCDTVTMEHLGYSVRRLGSRYHTTREMDSIRIKDRCTWKRYSNGTGGDTITFLQEFCGKGFRDAVTYLLEFNRHRARDSPAPCPRPAPQEEKPAFALPIPNQDQRRVFAYLQKRGIAPQVIRGFIESGLLYEDSLHHNCVFVGRDGNGKPVFASKRGTYDLGGSSFKRDAPGSDKSVAFRLPCDPALDWVAVFEAPIDLMSFCTLHRQVRSNAVALCGLYQPGVYSVKETATVSDHILDVREYHVELFPGQTSTLTIENQSRPNLIVYKKDADAGDPIPNTVFLVKAADGHSVDEIKTDSEGKATLNNLLPGVYEISEKSVPSPWLMDADPQLVTLYPNRDHTVYFENHKKPTLTINKVDSVTGSPIKGAKFQVWYDSNNTSTGELNSLGVFFSDTNGQIVIDNLRDGWYKVEGLEPGTTVKVREIKIVEGYVLDGTPQDILIKAGEAQQLTFWNKRAGTLVIQKKDSVTGALIPGAQFQLTYANGGYVDNDNGHLSSKGLYTTDDKGEIRISGITGTVVVKETKPAPGYVIDQSTQTQTVTVNPLDTQTLTFLNEPLCSLTLTKLDSVTGKPIPGTEFTVKDGNGTVLGRYTTGKDGTVTVTGLVPGSTVVVTETKVPDGYVLNPTPQTIIVKNGSNSVNSGTVGGTTNGNTGGSTNVGGGTNGGNDLVFENDPIGTFELIKAVEENKEKRIPNVTFEIRRASDDALVETVTTGSDGRVSLKLDAGDYYAVETEAAKGFKLDTTRHYFTMKNGKNTNRPDNNIQRRVLLCDFTL